jgi:hypothetical protein
MTDYRKDGAEVLTPILAVKTTNRKPSFGSDFENEKTAIVASKAVI